MIFETRIARLLFPSVIVKTPAEGIHLTFDDGPHPSATPAVLEILKKRNIHATFFLLGRNVEQYPDIARQVVSEGHQIGNHSYLHANLFFKSTSFVRQQINQAGETIEKNLGTKAGYFRPPYGYLNFQILKILKEKELKCVLWNIDSKDYCSNKQEIDNRIPDQISNGSILLFHDNHHTASKVHTYLPDILDKLLEKKYIFKRL
ncbi:MAG: polysaccharide deacetylase family protein [Bacteroidetes bacterium]|nr:polysaccharide deacetylase family protein [Bacteroidota bacterium]